VFLIKLIFCLYVRSPKNKKNIIYKNKRSTSAVRCRELLPPQELPFCSTAKNSLPNKKKLLQFAPLSLGWAQEMS